MSIRCRTILFLISILVLPAGCRQPHETDVDTLFHGFDGDVPGAAVMVVRDGSPLFVKAYGLANVEKGIPVTPATNFRLASVTKQFTSMAVMILVERGLLSYETTLADIFPAFPDYGAGITIRHLLQHTSGLVSYESLIPETATEQVLDRDVLRMMTTRDSTYFAPGSAYRYSNSGYAVLAMVVETISGMMFPDFLAENIFAPLGMDGSVAYLKGVNEVPRRSFGYRPDDSAFVFSDQSLTSAVLGDGGIYTSVVDLFKWDQALYTDRLVSRDTLDLAFTPGRLSNGEALSYGFGWNIGDYRGRRKIWHGGSTCGFRTAIHRYPDDRFIVIILTNRSVADTDSLAEKLADLFLFGEDAE